MAEDGDSRHKDGGGGGGGGGGLFGLLGQGLSSLSLGIAGAGSAVHRGVRSLLGGEHLEVVNPEGGQEDAEEEATKGRFKHGERESYWKMMHKYIGADVTSMVTLPVLIFEPMTMLQKMAELMEYTELLNKADECEDPQMKMVYAGCRAGAGRAPSVAGRAVSWAISVYVAYERIWKPFNPILGETYELVHHNGLSFIAEQVSHHPPMSAGHGENEHFTYDCTSKLKTKFLGNSLDVYPVGRTKVVLKKCGDVLDLVPPPTKVHNLIFGRTWIDSPGDMVLTNTTTGDKVVLYFQPCGWFGAGRYEVDGYAYNAAEEPKYMITGKWNSTLSCQPCDAEGEPLPGSALAEVWRVADAPKGDKFQYTYFAHKLNSYDTAPRGLLPSDSRLRPDRSALEAGDMNKAGIEKARLEERQRAEKREREAKKRPFSPRWFKLSGETVQTPWEALETYDFNGAYAEHRAAMEKEASAAEGLQQASKEFSPWQFDFLDDLVLEPKATDGIIASSSHN
eukprot:SM000090S24355  [mRNA]  locus=s90:517932:520825:- [translate_table: standard]